VRNAGGVIYCYDANGNMSSRGGQATTWFSYNLPNTINGGATVSSQFFYTPARARWKQVANYSGTTETTIYVGGLLEKSTRSGVTAYRHYIQGGSGVVAVYSRLSSGTNSTTYVAADHLGSNSVLMNASGGVLANLSYGAQGNRRGSNWQGTISAADATTVTGTTRRGFTEHEHLDNLSLIHMNGRVFDPNLGRFLSGDPLIQAPSHTQSYNRYAYVFNNPLSFTDPSGFQGVDANGNCLEGYHRVQDECM
jgi:RHS repeat-associated protein